MDTLAERYVLVRPTAARDLIDLSRQAAIMLRDRPHEAGSAALAAALSGAAAEVAADIADPSL